VALRTMTALAAATLCTSCAIVPDVPRNREAAPPAASPALAFPLLDARSTAHFWIAIDVTGDVLDAKTDEGYRLHRLLVTNPDVPRYAALLARDEGELVTGRWVWSYHSDVDAVRSQLNDPYRRGRDVSPYVLGNEVRYAVVLTDDTGAHDKESWWIEGLRDVKEVEREARAWNGRIVDLDSVRLGSRAREYTTIMVKNEGIDRREQEIGVASIPDIERKLLERPARVVAFAPTDTPDELAYVMEALAPGERAWFHADLTSGGDDPTRDVAHVWKQHGARYVEIERYLNPSGEMRWAAGLVDNFEAPAGGS
jgi:hypothetical protein